MVVFHEVAVLVDVQGVLLAVGKEPRLVGLPLGGVVGDGLGGGDTAAAQGEVFGHDAIHLSAKSGHIESLHPRDADVHPRPQGAGHLGGGGGPEAADGQKQHELGGAGVGIPTVVVGVVQKMHHPARGGHGLADRRAVGGDILLSQGNIVEGEDAPRDAGGDGVGGKAAR